MSLMILCDFSFVFAFRARTFLRIFVAGLTLSRERIS